MATPSAAPNRKQLTDDLANHEAQLDQVEAALTNDPDNEELLKLKNDLLDVKKLTLDLLELAPAPKPPQDHHPSSSVYQWKQGDRVKAAWPDNGKYYGALVEVLSGDGATASVRFDGYGTTIFVRLSELRPLTWKEEPADKQTKKVVKPNAKEKRAEIREYKKKKAAKKKEKMNEVEEFREHEKGRWKSFSQKSSKSRSGPLNAKQRKSIFAVPDSLEGKVGVGTCNVGGKGMTDFSSRTKNSSLKQDQS
ncbi:survival of motor neuron-related-splicing factor 30-like [Halichondria panicea]|uniref:survival of motor neuron-related-splicing factor 30-like n=1 Tax=Halichondria panicea TaxID=6063 RepID=UPI00312BC7F4